MNTKNDRLSNNSYVELGVFYHIFNALADPVFVKDEQHRWVYLNDAFCGFMGFERESLLGKSDYDFFPKDQADVFWQKDNETFNNEKETISEEFFTDADVVKHVISTKKSIFIDPKTKQKFLVGVIRDITEIRHTEKRLKQTMMQLEELSNTDQMTGLANRRQLHNVSDYHFQLARRNQLQVFLMFIDMDNLKNINDQFGHETGDGAIVEMANLLKTTLRGADIIARVGGDEFVILFHCNIEDGGTMVISRVEQAIDRRNAKTKRPYHLSASFGLAHAKPNDTVSLSDLMSVADNAMYDQKMQKKIQNRNAFQLLLVLST